MMKQTLDFCSLTHQEVQFGIRTRVPCFCDEHFHTFLFTELKHSQAFLAPRQAVHDGLTILHTLTSHYR